MTDKGFIENGFIVDLGNSQNAAEIIYELSSILDMPEAANKKICLKLGHIDLSRSQLLSIKSLIESMDSDLAFIDTTSSQTEGSALSLGIIVSELSNKIEVPEIEPDEFEMVEGEIKDKRVITEFEEEPEEGLSYQVLEHEEEEIEKEEPEEIVERSEKEEVLEISKLPTLYLQQNLRSGQTISYDGNIIIIGDVHPGSEIIAKGDITIWGVLGGIAHAGAKGNDSARIRALKINAIQLRISGFYARRPDALNIPFIQRTNDFTPEEARVENKAIAIYKTYDN
jgi:septum site-determining protein MinC